MINITRNMVMMRDFTPERTNLGWSTYWLMHTIHQLDKPPIAAGRAQWLVSEKPT